MKRLYLMITITNRVVGSGRFVDFYRPSARRWCSRPWAGAPPATMC